MTKRCHIQKLIKQTPLYLAGIILNTIFLPPCFAATGASDSVLKTQIQAKNDASSEKLLSAASSVTTTTPSIKNQAAQPDNPAITSPTVVPLNQPNMKAEALTKWAEDAVKSVYSFDFKNYKKQLQDTQKYFTESGWKAFNDALMKSNNLKIVEDKKLVASAITSKPTIVEEGIKQGRYTWKLQMPVTATYENESKLIKQNLAVTLLIARTTTPPGVGISHFIAQIIPQNTQPTTGPQTVKPSDTTTAKDINTPLGGTPNLPKSANSNNQPLNTPSANETPAISNQMNTTNAANRT